MRRPAYEQTGSQMGNGDEEVVNRNRARAQQPSGPQPTSSQPSIPGPFTMPFEIGQVIAGKYEIAGLIGVGGLGFVVAADHVELGEKVALKFLRPEALGNAEAVGRFAHEARAAAQIKSEHVARVFDVGSLPDGAPFIVMEYLEGSDLSGVLQERGPLPTQLAADYVLQACEALAAAHASGVVHRDIKPENLFLTRRGQGMDTIKVLDFGISKVALRRASGTRHPLVQTTMAMGSPIYMSPEQLRASKDIDARSDIWSVGCVLFELLTNRLAFDAPSITHVTAVILESEPPSLRAVAPTLPPGLEAIIRRCLAKNPNDRFQDVGELAVALCPYAPPQGRFSVERICAILRSAGLTSASLEEPSDLPDGVSALPEGVTGLPRGVVRRYNDGSPGSVDATASTPTVETPISRAARSLSSGRSVALAVTVAALAGMLVVLGLERRAPSGPAAAAAPAPEQLAPPSAPPSPPPPQPPATAPRPASAASAAPSSADTPPDDPGAEKTARAAAETPGEPEAADDSESPASRRADPEPASARSSKPAAASTSGSSKRRAAATPAKPTPAPAPRPQQPQQAPPPSNEPDVGF